MMRFLAFSLVLLVGVLLPTQGVIAQTYDLQFVIVNNDGVNLDVKLQIKANGSAFALGTSNMIFTFNSADLTNPTVLAAHNFSGGSYLTATTTGTGGNSMSLNYELIVPGTGTTVATSWTDAVTVRFTTLDPAGNANLQWNAGAIAIWKDDEATEVLPGTLTDLNTSPLPIQLASFAASVHQASGNVVLSWSTISETNNYGFEVQKSLDTSNVYETIENSFIKGNGTTVEPHTYTFTDVTVKPGVWYYRLKQTDLDGTIHYSDRITPSGVTDVNSRPLPTAFALDQNYPNPFNPSTTIEFALPKESRVTLEVFNLLGQRVALLVDDVRAAGYHAQRFDASGLGTGIYFYRLVAGETSFLKKMLLVK